MARASAESPPAGDCKHIIMVIEETELPLEPRTTCAVVVHDSLRAWDGGPIAPVLAAIARSTTNRSVMGEEAVRLLRTMEQLAATDPNRGDLKPDKLSYTSTLLSVRQKLQQPKPP